MMQDAAKKTAEHKETLGQHSSRFMDVFKEEVGGWAGGRCLLGLAGHLRGRAMGAGCLGTPLATNSSKESHQHMSLLDMLAPLGVLRH